MHNNIDPWHQGSYRIPVANIPLQELDPVLFRILKVDQVNSNDLVLILVQKVSGQIYSQETADTGDKYSHYSLFFSWSSLLDTVI
jgi:hypothetical protein